MIQPYHLLLPDEKHWRLRMVCSMLGMTMCEFIRPLVNQEVDRQWSRLGLDGVRPPSQAKTK
jgi:hypothetical protein